MRDRFDDILKSKLDEAAMEPAPGNWASVSNRLGLQPDSHTVQRRLWRYGSVAALLALTVGISIYSLDFDTQAAMEQDVLSTNATPEVRSLTTLINSAKKISTFTDAGLPVKKGSDMVLTLSNPRIDHMHTIKTIETSEYLREIEKQNATFDEEYDIKVQALPKSNQSKVKSVIKSSGMPVWPEDERETKHRYRTKAGKHWSMGLFAANAPIESKTGVSDIGSLRTMSSNTLVSDLVEIESYGVGRQEVITAQKLHHKMPISIGLSIRKNITRRIGIETGIVYSYLESTGDMTASMRYRRKQQLHYLGVPLAVSYSFVKYNKWDAYVLGGGMAEHSIGAKINTRIYRNNNIISDETVRIKPKGLLWSVNANVGVGFYPTRHFGFFVEPGINYYFKNDSQPESYRTENPLSFNLRFGIRTVF